MNAYENPTIEIEKLYEKYSSFLYNSSGYSDADSKDLKTSLINRMGGEGPLLNAYLMDKLISRVNTIKNILIFFLICFLLSLGVVLLRLFGNF